MKLVILTVALLLLTTTNAFAKTKRVPPDVALEQKPDFRVVVPQSQVDLDQYAVAPDDGIIRNIELSASSWTPTNLGWSSQVADSAKFQTNGAQISANYWHTAWNFKSVTISPKFGLSFAQLSRQGSMDVLGHQNSVQQSMNLYSLRLGAEVAPQADLAGHLQPFFDIALLPVWEQISSSDYSLAENHTGFALEETLGVAWRSPSLGNWIDARNLGFEIGLLDTQGLGSSLAGFGVFAGSRLEL